MKPRLGVAGRLGDRLVERFGTQRVFIGVGGIEPVWSAATRLAGPSIR
jgi:hypothetical protein